MKNALISTDDGKIYAASKIITEKYVITDKEQEIAHVLTDNNYIINSFTPNCIKLLNIPPDLTNINLDITKYISEIRKNIYLYDNHIDLNENKNNTENTNISSPRKSSIRVKRNLISKTFENGKKKLITWNIFDIYGKAPEKKSLSKFINSELREEFNRNKYLEEDTADFKRISFNIEDNKKITSSKLLNSNIIHFIDLKDLNSEKSNSDIHPTQHKDYECLKLKNNAKTGKKFYLTINEIKIGESKIGYIFKFESYNKNNTKYYSIYSSSFSPKKSQIKPDNDNEKSIRSDISFAAKNPSNKTKQKLIIFNKTSENPNGIDLGLDITFIPKLENEFYFDSERMSYRQFNIDEKDINNKISDNLLREEAEKKLFDY
jgi:hypothetical protein